jgi:hypothetical protein
MTYLDPHCLLHALNFCNILFTCLAIWDFSRCTPTVILMEGEGELPQLNRGCWLYRTTNIVRTFYDSDADIQYSFNLIKEDAICGTPQRSVRSPRTSTLGVKRIYEIVAWQNGRSDGSSCSQVLCSIYHFLLVIMLY